MKIRTRETDEILYECAKSHKMKPNSNARITKEIKEERRKKILPKLCTDRIETGLYGTHGEMKKMCNKKINTQRMQMKGLGSFFYNQIILLFLHEMTRLHEKQRIKKEKRKAKNGQKNRLWQRYMLCYLISVTVV